MQINYKHLKYFWAVAHEGNLTRAASKLNVSQSALSTQIQKLEQQLGHPLFERIGRKLQLTEAGHIALDHADAVFETGEELVATLRQVQSNKTRVLRVGATFNLSRNFQLRFLQPVLGRADAHVVIRSGALPELLQAIESHELDIILSNLLPNREGITNWIPRLVDEQTISLVGMAEMAEQGATIEALLTQYPLIVPSMTSGIRADLDAIIKAHGWPVRIAAEADDMAMLRLLARMGFGIAVIPPIVVRDELQSGMLRELLPIPDLTERFYAIVRASRFPNPLVEELFGDAGV